MESIRELSTKETNAISGGNSAKPIWKFFNFLYMIYPIIHTKKEEEKSQR